MEGIITLKYALGLWDFGVGHIAGDEYHKKHEMMRKEYLKNAISLEDFEQRVEELIKEVVDVLGQPQHRRPYCGSDLSTWEREAKEIIPSLFMMKWEKIWMEWEEMETKDTRWFWGHWGVEVWKILNPETACQPFTCDVSHQSVNNVSGFVSCLKTMQSTLEESQTYAPDRIEQVAAVLKSTGALSQRKKDWMAKTLMRVQHALGRGFEKIGEGIATLLKAIQNGLAPETKGYKALQENFAEFTQAISQLSTLHDLALKAHSKGLISWNGKEEIFAPGCSGLEKANKFLGLIQARIKRDGKAYDTFVSILRSEPAYEHLVVLAGVT